MSETKRKRGRPEGSQGPTRRFNRGLAHYAREHLPPELLFEWYFAIAQGFDAILVKDERCTSTGGYRVEHRQGGMVPSLEQRMRAMQDARHAAYGLPAQQIMLDAQVKQQAMIAVAGVDLRTLQDTDVRGRAEMLAAIERALGPGGGSTEREPQLDAVDAEYSDVRDQGGAKPSTESGVDPSTESGVDPSTESGVDPSTESGVDPSNDGGVDGA